MVNVKLHPRYRVRVYLSPSRIVFTDFFCDFIESAHDLVLNSAFVADVHKWSRKDRDYTDLVFSSKVDVESYDE